MRTMKASMLSTGRRNERTLLLLLPRLANVPTRVCSETTSVLRSHSSMIVAARCSVPEKAALEVGGPGSLAGARSDPYGGGGSFAINVSYLHSTADSPTPGD